MSRRVIAQKACRTLQAREGQVRTIRCFATTSTSQLNRLTQGQGSQKRILKESKKKDDKLRHAINIFQLADWFFPTTAGESASTSSSLLGPSARAKTSEKKAAAKDELDEVLDDHIRGSIMGNTTAHSSRNSFDATLSMKNAYNAHMEKIERDNNQFSNIYESNKPSDEITEGLIASIFPSSDGVSLSARRSAYATNEDDSTSPLQQLPPIEDRKAVEKYVANTVKRAAAIASQDRQRAGNLDVRGAQVMDALYGTVGGHLPGLEVLKERVKEREQREQQQQQLQMQMEEQQIKEEK